MGDMRSNIFWFSTILALFLLLFIGKMYMYPLNPNHSIGISFVMKNISNDLTLESGLVVVHNHNISFNYEGTRLSEHPFFPEVKQLVETARPLPLKDRLSKEPQVRAVFTTATLPPDAEQTLSLGRFTEEELENYSVSFLSMIAGSNDGYVFMTTDMNVILNSSANIQSRQFYTQSFDAGTEENNPFGSGFIGGQIDNTLSEEENKSSGIKTDEQVTKHPDLEETPMMKMYFSR